MKHTRFAIATYKSARRNRGFAVVMTLAAMLAVVAAVALFGLAAAHESSADARYTQRSAMQMPAAVSLQRQAGLFVQDETEDETEGLTPCLIVGESANVAGDATETSGSSSSAADASGSSSAADEGTSSASTEASSASASSAQAESASGNATTADVATSKLEQAISTADGTHYTVRLTYGTDAGIPAGAELSVVQVVQTPEGYDPKKAEFKNRPAPTEKFVSANEMKARVAQLRKAVDATDADYAFYSAFLDISIKANGKVVQPAAAVEVTVETDAVDQSASDSLRASFYAHVEQGATRAYPLALANQSGDAKADKEYEKGAKVSFATDALYELGIAGVAVPLQAWQAAGHDLTVYGPASSSVQKAAAAANALPEGAELVEAFGLAAAPIRAYGTQLWIGAKAADASEANEPIACYALEGESVGACLFEGPAGAPVAVKAGDAVALAQFATQDSAAALEGEGAPDTQQQSVVRDEEGGLAALLVSRSTPSLGVSLPLALASVQRAQLAVAASENVHAITWLDEDGSLLHVDTVEEGTVPSYDPNPSKPADAQYTYAFTGWTPEVVAATEDATYTATYAKTVNTYAITWTNYDGSVLETDAAVEYGATPTYDGATPTKPEDAGGKYAFSYWDPNPEPVTGNATYKAVYTSAPVELCVQDFSTKQPFAGATFALTNDSTHVAVWAGTTTANGVLAIERKAEESEGCGGATFENGSSYTLTQTASDEGHYRAQGSWTLAVDAEGAFSCTVHPASESDLTTRAASGPYGIRFYLYNVASSAITYQYNYPEGVSGQPEDATHPLSELGYSVSYTVSVGDPAIPGYEFVGWVVDGTTRTVKHGDVVSLDTVNVRSHTMTACWRSPLNMVAKTYADGDSVHAAEVEGSEAAYQLAEEKSLTFSSLPDLCAAYGEQNQAVRDLNASSDYEFMFAQVENGTSITRVEAVQYDAGAHAWRYRASGGSSWTDIAQGDQLQLHYASELVSVKWVMQSDDGAFSTLDEGRFPAKTVAVSSEWVASDDLVAAAERPVVHGLGYFRSLGIGPDDASQLSDLDKAGLQSFSLKNSEGGFLFRADTSGEGELLSHSTVYLVYSETPPDNSVYLDVENNTAWPYRLDNLFVGGEQPENDMLAQGRVVLLGSETLQVMNPQGPVVAGSAARLVLLGAGASSFVANGGFAEEADDGTVVSAAVANSGSIVRTALVKEGGDDPLANTSAVTRGMLEDAPGKVVVSFDSALTSLTVNKTWSDDSYPDAYQADFALFEDGVRCTTSESTTGYYTVNKDGGWSVVVENLPSRCTYTVTEQAVRQMRGTTTVADVTDQFTATYDTSEAGVIAVANTRSNDVCQVGNNRFRTVKAAVDYIVEHGMANAAIEMLDSYIMAESGAVVVPEGYDITLTTVAGEDPKTITRGFAGTADMFKVEAGSSLSVTNVTLTGKLDNAYMAKEGNGGLVLVDGGTLTAGTGAAFTNGKAANGSAIYAQNGATVKLAGAKITANQATSGGAVGVSDDGCRILVTGDTYVYNNRDGDGRNQRNLCLDQDSNEVTQVVDGGLGASAHVGVYVSNGESSALYNAHGLPAKPFATYASGADANLNALVNDRMGDTPSKYGHASTILDNTVVWGETFSFTAKKQWLDEHFNVIDAPQNATTTLRLSGGSTTPADSVQTTVTLTGAENPTWTYTFTGLARYDGNGNPYEYKLVESGAPADFKQVAFTGDKATADNPITYSDATGDNQVAIVSNYYRYTTLTVNKTVSPAIQGLKSTFKVYGVPKAGADLSSAVRYGGVGGVNDLPLELRGGVASLNGITQDGLFYTEEGGNVWHTKIGGDAIPFHAFYDNAFYTISADASGGIVIEGIAPQRGDVVHPHSSGYCSIYDGSSWHTMARMLTTSYISFTRQDGNDGVEGVGGVDMGKSCTIDCTASSTGTYMFTTDAKLSSDYYYYVVETSVQEVGGAQPRSISGSHKLVATYDPQYSYDQRQQIVSVANTRQDYLSVDKVWPADATNLGTCVFDVYKVSTGGATVDYLNDPAKFKDLVKGSSDAWENVGEFSLPEADTGSWVHVLKDISQEDLAANVYFVREREAGGIAIVNPDVSDSSTTVDAVYGYDDQVNQITVRNMSDVLCKVVDTDGTEHPFRTLNDALDYGRTRDASAGSNTEFAIEMLRDYSIPASDIMKIEKNEKITLTTASTTKGAYRYKNSDSSVTRATITRQAGNTWSFFIVSGEVGGCADTSFTLENIALDGLEVPVSYQINRAYYYNGGLVHATNATVVLKEGGDPAAGVEARNAKANNGGAIYAPTSNVSISGASFKNCQSTDTNSGADRGGGAIWTSGTDTTVENSTFDTCTAKRAGGAAFAYSNVAGTQTTIAGTTFNACSADVNGGAVYTRNYALSMGGGEGGACTFTSCTTGYRGGGVFHDNLNEGSVANVTDCTFTDCKTTTGDGNNANRHGGAGMQTGACDLVITDCTFTRCETYSRGGGLMHYNLNAATGTISKCAFTSCTSSVSGGGGVHASAIDQLITDCVFTDCTAYKSAGGGLDIGCFDIEKTAKVADCTFTRCTAGSDGAGDSGGGICFGGTSLTVEGTSFDACAAAFKTGGGVSMSAGGTMQELAIRDCSFTGCTALGSGGSGGAVHTLGTGLRIERTTCVDCSARNTGGAVYQALKNANTQLVASCVAIADTTFTGCAAQNGSGGAVYANALTVSVDGQADVVTFKECSAKTEGGALRHERSAVDASTALNACGFEDCESMSGAGGAVSTYATKLDVAASSFKRCTSWNTGGALYHRLGNNDQVPTSTATFTDAVFADCQARSASAGAVYTTAQTLTMAGKPGVTTFDTCSASASSGAVFHERNTEKAQTDLSQCSFKACSATNNEAGALRTTAPALTIHNVSFDSCTAKSSGGAVYHQQYNNSSALVSCDLLENCAFTGCVSTNGSGGGLYTGATKHEARAARFVDCSARNSGGGMCQGTANDSCTGVSRALLTGCTFTNCQSTAQNAGALYTNALELEVIGEDDAATFKGCTAYQNGGAIQHNRAWEASKTTLKQVSFESCTATTQSGGAVFVYVTKVDAQDCSFADCTAKSTAGGLYHKVNNNNNVAASDTTVARCAFTNCASTNASSGAVYTDALTLGVTGAAGETTFDTCTASSNGGAVSHDRNWEAAATKVEQCSFSACSTAIGRGGAVYSSATQFSMSDTSCIDCTAKQAGGAVCHVVNDSYVSASKALVSHGTFTNCKSVAGNAGALYSEALAITVDGASGRTAFLNCSSAYDGGAFYQKRNNEKSVVTLSDCDFNLCSCTYANGNNRGGAAYVRARTLVVDGCSFDTCVAKGHGGCLAVYPETAGTNSAIIRNSSFVGGESLTGSGGALYAVRTEMELVGTSVAQSTAASNGGGVYFDDWEKRPATIDGCTLNGNSAQSCGGGVYFFSDANLTLRNGTSVTGNTLGNATVANAAGVYLNQSRSGAVLVLGAEGAASDTITVYDNKTSAGEQSNVRLITGGSWQWVDGVRRYDDKHGDLNNTDRAKYSVNLLSNLDKPGVGAVGTVGVANPGPENTRFGLGDVGYRTGVEHIMSDIDTLIGKIDPSDLEGRRIIWYAPPVCKITDQYGRTLTYDNGKTAAFSSLSAAYAVANNLTEGYIVDDKGVTPTNIQIQMLVASYTLEASMPALQRDITLTTANAGAGEFDYPLDATSAWCTITRGANVAGSMFTAASGKTMTVSTITLDGGNLASAPRVANVNGGIIHGNVNAAIVLSENAVLQNAAVAAYNNGGAVYVTGGTDPSKPALVMERNATIAGCAAGNGGGVYLTGGALFRMNDAPHIEGCSATTAGGAVYVSPYATMSFFDNPNGVIRNNFVASIDGAGAGIYLPSNDSTLLLQLGASAAISGNYVAGSQDASRTNGGDPYPLLYQDIYLGEAAEPATSITLAGNMSQPEGSIYVWARAEQHYKTETQFAVVATNAAGTPTFVPLDSTLAVFRNARDDADSENDTDTYLYGIQEDGTNVIWSYTTGSSPVVLRKENADREPLAGATFTVYKGRSARAYVVRHDDGTRETLAGLTSLENGTIWVGMLPYGVYYLHETAAPAGYSADRWFRLTVDEAGTAITRSAPTRAALSS